MKKQLAALALVLFLSACTPKADATCLDTDRKKLTFFSDKNGMVTEVHIEEYDIAINKEIYEASLPDRKAYLESVEKNQGIKTSINYSNERVTTSYQIVFADLESEVRDALLSPYELGPDLNLDVLVKRYEALNYQCD